MSEIIIIYQYSFAGGPEWKLISKTITFFLLKFVVTCTPSYYNH